MSSTFSDLKAERDALRARVFPKLREFCAQRGARFQAIDLRWRVSSEASRDQRTMNICLDEIERCQAVTPRPNFIVLLGDRCGWRPPPGQIPAARLSVASSLGMSTPIERWRESTLFSKDPHSDRFWLTGNGSWFVGNMISELMAVEERNPQA